ncbi:Endothelial cell-specific molecule 1 [Branchiostoma belcheri]|nr:Endothelial cell-specific molecule 1 [Branchiostoma belcheri]
MCKKQCECENGARCHGLNGACKCQPGWQGVVCDIPHSTVAIKATPSDSRQIHIKGSLTLECRAFNLAVERMMWGFPNGTKTWLQRTQEDQVRIESIRSEHNGTYTCTVVTEDERVFVASYELQAVTCPPGKTGELCEDDCDCPEEASCERWAGCVCPPGYVGTMCETWCPHGTFGQNCSSECQCQNGARCNNINGYCFCGEGWFGVDCSTPCPSGRYGDHCQHACSCKNNATCHHVDGNCTCEAPWTGQWCEVIQTDSFQLPLQISVPLLLVLFVSAVLVVLCMWKRATQVKKEEGLEEAQALLELTSIMEENLAQSLQPGWLNRWEREAKDLTLGQLIGLGTFAHIRKGHLRIDNADVTVAVKSVRGEDKQCYQTFCREVAALIAVHENQEHNNGVSNIVRLFGVITKSTPKCVLLEYASGDLLQHLKRLKQQTERRSLNPVLLLSNVLRYAVHISRALEELRRLPIAHGDVAARNVLIGGDDVAKLTDFGLARDVYSTISANIGAEELLPLKWMALESLKCRKFTCESDTWSFGVLLWEIAAFGEEPNYQGMVRFTYPNLVEFLRGGKRLLKPRGCPDRLYDVMRSCWREEPSARPTPEELEQKLTECRHEIDLQFGEKETTV